MKNKLFKALALILVFNFILGMLIACGDNTEIHSHAFSEAYAYDSDYHWTECECGEKTAEAIHVGGEAGCTEKARCETCGAEYGELEPHSYTEFKTDDKNHWYECVCGAKNGIVDHNYKTAKKDADNHWYECSCGAKSSVSEHEFCLVKFFNADSHWLKCTCGQEAPAASHNLVNLVCGCGYKAPGWDHVHDYNILRCDSEGHWYECSCKEISGKTSHTGGQATCTKAAECEVCTVSYGETVPHEYNIAVITEDAHRYECACGKAQESIAHTFTDGACECGYLQPSAGHVHDYSILKYNEINHWYECVCKVSFTKEAHNGENATCDTRAVCETCQQSYGDFGHKWNSGELTTPNTLDTSGTITYTCEECEEKKNEIVAPGVTVTTRADLEFAIAEVAWAYYFKGEKMQYDSVALSAIGNHYGGTCRHTREASPEFGTSDTTIYSVCTGFPTKVYLEAFDRYIWENKVSPNGVLTMWFWLASDNQSEENFIDYYETSVDPITENDRDTALVRWMDFEKYVTDESEELKYAYALGTFDSTAFGDWYEGGNLEFRKEADGENYSYYLDGRKISAAEAKLLVFDYVSKKQDGEYVNLRPGDLFTEDTHTLMYIGNGYVLDCMGYKYDISLGEDAVEAAGIRNRKTVENILMKDATSDYILSRPLNYYAKDYDGDPGNDIIKFNGESVEMTEATESRLEYPAMEIDRTVDITPYGTAAKDGTVTYSIKITNNTNEEKYSAWRKKFESGYAGENYDGLVVTETIPEGTAFVSASTGYELDNGVLRWTVNVPVGACVEITYTVKVTAEVGSIIVSDGGTVANIPSNSISNRVGYPKFTEAQTETLVGIINSNPEEWKTLYGTDLDFAEGIYRAIGAEIDLPTLEAVIENLFTPTYFEKQISMTAYYEDKDIPIVMYVPQDEVSDEYAIVKDMLVDRYFGGYRMFSADLEKFKEQGISDYDFREELDKMILEFSFDYLEVGDILVYATAKNRTDTELTSELASSRILVYAGNETFLEMNSEGIGALYSGEDAEKILSSSFKSTNDLFFLLRPSEAVELSDKG